MGVELRGDGYLIMRPIEYEERYPSVNCWVEVGIGEFRGADDLWFEMEALERFKSELESLIRTQAGSCELPCMSPGFFRLAVQVLDRGETYLISVALQKANWVWDGGEDHYRPHQISVTFTVSHSAIGQLTDLLHGTIQGRQQ